MGNGRKLIYLEVGRSQSSPKCACVLHVLQRVTVVVNWIFVFYLYTRFIYSANIYRGFSGKAITRNEDYSPVSLMNIDLKIFSSILTNQT